MTSLPHGLAALVRRTTVALADAVVVAEDGRTAFLHEGSDGPRTPDDHYAHTFAALALRVSRDSTPGGQSPLPESPWVALIDGWRGLPEDARGHAPFHRLALLLLSDLEPGAAALLRLCPTERRYPSNNWTLLARACDVLETGEVAGFDTLCRRWFTPEAAFIDQPATPGPTPTIPIVYHAKAAMLLALVARRNLDAFLRALAERAAHWMLDFMDERAGLLGGFGRSTHALFGDACAMFVLLERWSRATPAERPRWQAPLETFAARLEASRRSDGLLPLNPHADKTGEAAGWDPWMHTSVYNAYFAGLLEWGLARLVPSALHDADAAPERVQHVVPAHSRSDTAAGLLAIHRQADVAMVSTRGQPAQSFGSSHADLRTPALCAFHVRCGDRALGSPLVRVAVEQFGKRPHLAGGTPVFRHGTTLYGLTRLDSVRVLEDGARLLVLGRGVPRRLHHVPPGRGSAGWWLETVDHLLLHDRARRKRGLAPPKLSGHEVFGALALDLEHGWRASAWMLVGRAARTIFLNPFGAAWTGPEPPSRVWASHGEAARLTVHGPLPASLPDAAATCGDPVAWPRDDAVFGVTLALDERTFAEADTPLMSVDVAAREVVVPWTTEHWGE